MTSEEYKVLKFVNGEEVENSGLAAVVYDMNNDQGRIFRNFLIFGFEEDEMACFAEVNALQLVRAVEKIHEILEGVLEKASPAARAAIFTRLYMEKAMKFAREEMQKK